MNKIITSFVRWLIKGLDKTVSWLEQKNASDMQPKFVDLAPTDDADKAGTYSEALRFATNNSKISNIALTGPLWLRKEQHYSIFSEDVSTASSSYFSRDFHYRS